MTAQNYCSTIKTGHCREPQQLTKLGEQLDRWVCSVHKYLLCARCFLRSGSTKINCCFQRVLRFILLFQQSLAVNDSIPIQLTFGRYKSELFNYKKAWGFSVWNLKYHALIGLHLYSSLPKIELRSVDICIYVPLGINTYCQKPFYIQKQNTTVYVGSCFLNVRSFI